MKRRRGRSLRCRFRARAKKLERASIKSFLLSSPTTKKGTRFCLFALIFKAEEKRESNKNEETTGRNEHNTYKQKLLFSPFRRRQKHQLSRLPPLPRINQFTMRLALIGLFLACIVAAVSAGESFFCSLRSFCSLSHQLFLIWMTSDVVPFSDARPRA